MTEYFLEGLKIFINWFLDFIRPLVETMLDPIAEAIPDMTPQTTAICEYMSFVNGWIALDVMFSMLGFYMVYILIMISVKLIVKLFVPTVG